MHFQMYFEGSIPYTLILIKIIFCLLKNKRYLHHFDEVEAFFFALSGKVIQHIQDNVTPPLLDSLNEDRTASLLSCF